MEFHHFLKARKYANSKKLEAGSDFSNTGTKDEQFSEPKEVLYRYIFALQSRLETINPKGMEYHVYAENMWSELIDNNPISEEDKPIFKKFENSIIRNLHNIDMQSHVYEHVKENISHLIEQYQKSVKNIALWSTGDVEPTGYQIRKIDSSKIINDYYKELKSKGLSTDFKDKTSYLVADNKFDSISSYVNKVLESNPGEKIKIVLIEDSVSNFKKVKDVLQNRSDKIEIIPIWASYSREGIRMTKEAEVSGQTEVFNTEKEKLNSINSFEDLRNSEKFGPIFDGAHVFVDFDGVIGNNVSMRLEQAKVVHNALMTAYLEKHPTTTKEDAEMLLEANIASLKNQIF